MKPRPCPSAEIAEDLHQNAQEIFECTFPFFAPEREGLHKRSEWLRNSASYAPVESLDGVLVQTAMLLSWAEQLDELATEGGDQEQRDDLMEKIRRSTEAIARFVAQIAPGAAERVHLYQLAGADMARAAGGVEE